MLANPNNADAAMQTGKQRHSPQFTLLAKVARNEECKAKQGCCMQVGNECLSGVMCKLQDGVEGVSRECRGCVSGGVSVDTSVEVSRVSRECRRRS